MTPPEPAGADPQSAPEEHVCPTCGYAVFGLPQNRCPECGVPFTWEAARAAGQYRRTPLLEHHWREELLPVLLRTWCLAAFHPRQLWAVYSAAPPPEVLPLVLFAVMQAVVFRFGWDALALVIDPAMNTLGAWVERSTQTAWTFAYQLRLSGDDLVDVAAWYVATFLSLQIFFESKQRAGAGWRKVLRVYVHASAPAALMTAVWCVLEAGLDMTLFFRGPNPRLDPRWYDRLGEYVQYAALAVTWLYLWIGYRRHLKMPHGWAIAAVGLFVGWVAMSTLRVWVF